LQVQRHGTANSFVPYNLMSRLQLPQSLVIDLLPKASTSFIETCITPKAYHSSSSSHSGHGVVSIWSIYLCLTQIILLPPCNDTSMDYNCKSFFTPLAFASVFYSSFSLKCSIPRDVIPLSAFFYSDDLTCHVYRCIHQVYQSFFFCFCDNQVIPAFIANTGFAV